MKISTCTHASQIRIPTTDEAWHALGKTLLSHITNCLYTYQIVHWRGGEPEMAKDVLQETYLRALRSAHEHEERDDLPPINNFEAFCKTIATRYILDLYRKDRRFLGSLDNDDLSVTHTTISMSADPAELALEDLSLYSIMLTFSQLVKRFPARQRTAILIDLAHHANFDAECPTPLERAMQAVGIPLQEYYCALPRDPVLRKRHSALVCLAYKRLRLVFDDMHSQLNSVA